MSDIDFTGLTQQIITTTGIMHHQTKLDIFIIRAYKLLSSGSIINTNTLHSVTSSPQTTSNTPAGTSNASSTNAVATGAAVSTATANGNNIAGNNNINGSNTSVANGNGNPISAIANGASTTMNTGTSNNPIQLQYSQLFGKISKLYNATISSGSIDDRSTSPKSAIELYQRFQQIIKELELSYEVSPYSKYFKRLDQGLWQIKDDSELKSDRLWEHVTMCIFSIYDPRTGQMINQGRRKANSLAASTKGSPTENNNSNTNSSNNNNSNASKRNQRRISNSAGNAMVNPTINSMMMDASLPQQLQRRLQTISQDVNSRSLNGYYTQPTSPGPGGFGFGLENDATLYNPSGNNSSFNNNASTSWKRRSLGSLGEDALDDDTVEELLQLTNTAKRQRTATPINFNNVNGNNLNSINNDPNQTINPSMNQNMNPPMNPPMNHNMNQNMNQNLNQNMNPNMNQTMNPQAVINNSAGLSRNNTVNGFSNSNESQNDMMINDTLSANNQNMNGNSNTLANGDVLVRQIKNSYDSLITEKNQRINHLERELEMQRQETQWLRKMLIEDMGCIRSLLKDLRR